MAISVWPYGASNCTGPACAEAEVGGAAPFFRSARVVEPYERTTTSAWPALIASTACATMTSHVPPPTPVESIHVGPSPRYSATSIGGRVPVPLRGEPVDVVLAEPGVGHRTVHRLRVQVVWGELVDPPDVGQGDADDGDPALPFRHLGTL